MTAAPFAALERICSDAVVTGVVPGGVVLCAKADDEVGAPRFHYAFGARQRDPRSLPATLDTVYDVASLTKAVVTSVVAMRAVDSGLIALDDPVVSHLPEFQGDAKAAVTVRHLLGHASGLPAHRPFHERVRPGPTARAAIVLEAAREPLQAAPGAVSVYSDLGFILLGALLERALGVVLDIAASRAIFRPLGLVSTTFVDLRDDDDRLRLLARAPVAATQRCTVRGGVIVGQVDDLNAYAMGGVAGHAGLFSDALGLSRIAACLCRAWRGDTRNGLVSPAVLRRFWSPTGLPDSTWRLGWDGPASTGSQAGALISRQAVGHLGFTGCSLWIDPARGAWTVLLTNRVHPVARPDPRFRALRAAVQDAAVAGMETCVV